MNKAYAADCFYRTQEWVLIKVIYRSDDRLSEGGAHHVEARDGHLENFFFIGYKRHKYENRCKTVSRFQLQETSSVRPSLWKV